MLMIIILFLVVIALQKWRINYNDTQISRLESLVRALTSVSQSVRMEQSERDLQVDEEIFRLKNENTKLEIKIDENQIAMDEKNRLISKMQSKEVALQKVFDETKETVETSKKLSGDEILKLKNTKMELEKNIRETLVTLNSKNRLISAMQSKEVALQKAFDKTKEKVETSKKLSDDEILKLKNTKIELEKDIQERLVTLDSKNRLISEMGSRDAKLRKALAKSKENAKASVVQCVHSYLFKCRERHLKCCSQHLFLKNRVFR